jgi:hypothetical protein
MDSSEFLREQFLTLREEIRETKTRIYRTIGFGLIVVPGAHLLGDRYEIDMIILALPLLVVVVALVFLAENNALMRCGRFIKHNVEPKFPSVAGWERWLEEYDEWDARNVDRYLSYAFYLLFLVYFVSSSYLGVRYLARAHSLLVALPALALYAVSGTVFVTYLIRNMRLSTSTASEPKSTKTG